MSKRELGNMNRLGGVTSLLASLCLALCFNTEYTYAQRQGAPPLSAPKENVRKPALKFKAPRNERELPAVGEPFTVHVNLFRTKDTEQLLRAYIVKDGVLEERTIGNAYLNEYDIPTYDVEFNSPQADLEMQFHLTTEDGETIWSKPHQVSRSCIPNPNVADLTKGAGQQVKDRIPILIDQAASLENELKTYEHALNLIEKLQMQFSGEGQ